MVHPVSRRPAPRHRGRTVALVLVLGALVVGLASCSSLPTYTGPPGGPRVGVVGDSLIGGVKPLLTDSLIAAGWRTYVRGDFGSSTAGEAGRIGDIVATRPEAIVIALGTNEVGKMALGTQDLDGVRGDVRAAIQRVSPVGCLVWVGVNDSNGASFGWPMWSWGAPINRIITEELAASGRAPGSVVYADWAAASRGHPEYFNAPDDVHLSAAGNEAYNRLIVDSAAQCDRAPGPTTATTR